MHKIWESGLFLGRLLEPVLKTGLPLIGNVLKPLSENVLISLGLTAVVAATDAAIPKKSFSSGTMTLIISNEGMNNIMKIVNLREKPGLLIKCISETVKNEAKEHKGGFLGMSLGTLSATLLGSLLAGKGTIRVGDGKLEHAKIFNVASCFNKLWNTKILLKWKDGASVINLNKFKSIGTHWMTSNMNAENATHFASFADELILTEISKLIGNKYC